MNTPFPSHLYLYLLTKTVRTPVLSILYKYVTLGFLLRITDYKSVTRYLVRYSTTIVCLRTPRGAYLLASGVLFGLFLEKKESNSKPFTEKIILMLPFHLFGVTTLQHFLTTHLISTKLSQSSFITSTR